MTTPLCLFWTVWQARNRVAFEDVAPSAQNESHFFMYLVVLGKFV